METIFDYNQIKQIIPHGQPFLLIDKVVEYEEGQRCVAIKRSIRANHFFQGHFPGYAVMPGVLITGSVSSNRCGSYFKIVKKIKVKSLYLLVLINVVLNVKWYLVIL